MKNIANKKVCVIGAGLSGIHAAVLAAHHQANVFLSEGLDQGLAADDKQLLADYEIAYELGQHSEKIENADLYIISPGIPKESDIYQRLQGFDKPIISEIELASWFVSGSQIIAVTGTNGKSTTVRLIDHLFSNTKYKAYLGGNIGIPFSKLVLETENISNNKVYILEISSFQLEDIIGFRPYISTILNITPDHLNRYQGSIEKYLQAKLRIAENQRATDYYYYYSENRLLSTNLPKAPQTKSYDQDNNLKDLVTLKDDGSIQTKVGQTLKVRGHHNYTNILAALAICDHFDISENHLLDKLKSFRGLPHRLEYVSNINNIEFYNDSKATNIDSVIQALKSFTNPIILILGGRDKDLNFTKLIPFLQSNTKEIILVGEAAAKIKTQLGDIIPTVKVDTMKQVVDQAWQAAESKDVVLLSPGCASYDMYDNYKKRGADFKAKVKNLEEQKRV